jgi:predicted nucleic acid-binding Zn ribbon protein
MKSNFYADKFYRLKQSELSKLSWQRGEHDCLRKIDIRTCARKGCKNKFKTIPSDPKRYCSSACSAIVNNTGRVASRVKEKKFCLNCEKPLLERYQLKYCSSHCQNTLRHKKWIEMWKSGEKSGNVGVTAKNLSANLKRYIINKYDNKCARCGWNEKNPVTGLIMVEIEHIDGNSENNTEENLTLLCPNCHSLTQFYKNLNRGNGRKWRMDKYIKNA